MSDEKNDVEHPKTEEEEKSFRETIDDLMKRLRTMKEWDTKTWIYVGIFAAVVAATLLLYLLIAMNPELLFSIVVNFVKWVLDFPWQIVIVTLFIVFMAVQGLLMPIPSEMILLMAGAMWGLWGGFVAGLIGSIFAATLCYWIAAKGGGPVVEKFVGAENVEAIDVYLQKTGAPIVFALRAFPLMSFDIVSYVSGLVKLDFWKYLIANILGCITRALFWAWLGDMLVYDTAIIYSIAEDTGSACYGLAAGLSGQELLLAMSDACLEEYISQQAGNFNFWIVILVVVTVAFMILYNYVIIPYLKKQREKELAEMSSEERRKLLKAEKSVKEAAQPKDEGISEVSEEKVEV